MSRRVCILLISLALASSSCVLRGPAGVQRDIAEATGAEYEKEFGITLGRVGMSIARWATKNEDDMPVSLRGVRKVQVGMYRVREGTWDEEHPRFDPSVLGDWNPLVAIQDHGEDVHVLFKEKDGQIRSMLVLVSEPDELIIVRLKGRLDDVFREAMRYGLEEAGREEYYEPALEQLEGQMGETA